VDNKVIAALDMADMNKVRQLVETLGDTIDFYKVGMELFYSVGAAAIEYLRSCNKKVFLDLKLHDIPNTVEQGIGALVELRPTLITVHASGGRAMLQAAVRAAAQRAEVLGIPRPKIIAITVLTSINDQEWTVLGGTSPISEQVVRLAQLAQDTGIDGVVASPQEAAAIRAACGREFLIITPGIRPQGAAVNDQSRTATPAAALAAGADYLVIGRPITQATFPAAAAADILQEVEDYLCSQQK